MVITGTPSNSLSYPKLIPLCRGAIILGPKVTQSTPNLYNLTSFLGITLDFFEAFGNVPDFHYIMQPLGPLTDLLII